jgi:hypothetical protein
VHGGDVKGIWIGTILLVTVLASTAQDRFFPPRVFSDDARLDQFVSDWYSTELRILDEPSLLQIAEGSTGETYRFLWLRTFHHPVAVRLDVRPDGIGVLSSKVATGSAGFPDKRAHLIENVSRPISREQTQTFLREIVKLDFWALPSYDEHRGEDGAEWIVEAAKQGKYHVVVRWSPKEGQIRELGLALAIGLADLQIPKEDIY